MDSGHAPTRAWSSVSSEHIARGSRGLRHSDAGEELDVGEASRRFTGTGQRRPAARSAAVSGASRSRGKESAKQEQAGECEDEDECERDDLEPSPKRMRGSAKSKHPVAGHRGGNDEDDDVDEDGSKGEDPKEKKLIEFSIMSGRMDFNEFYSARKKFQTQYKQALSDVGLKSDHPTKLADRKFDTVKSHPDAEAIENAQKSDKLNTNFAKCEG